MISLVVKDPESVSLDLYELKGRYPSETRLALRVRYKKAEFEITEEKGSKSEEYTGGFYVLTSKGYIILVSSPALDKKVEIAAELTDCWIPSGRPLSLTVYSKPISRNEIHEIDEKLRTDDLRIEWIIEAYGFLSDECARQYNVGLVPIFIRTARQHLISRRNFVKNVLGKADMLRREFIEIVVEPVDLSYVKNAQIRIALQLLSEKQKLLLGAMNKLIEAKDATDFRGVIDEVRRVVEGLELDKRELGKLYKEIYKKLLIESIDTEAIKEASEEIVETLNKYLNATFKYASKFGIHTTTERTRRLYTPIPTRREAEFAVQQALLQVNYLVKLLNMYAMRAS